jgi:hypothetical protein
MDKYNPFKSNATSPHIYFPQVRSFILILLFIVLSFTLAGCVTFNDPEASQEYNSDSVGTLDLQTVIGQSFISRRSNLNGVTIWISISSDQGNSSVNSGLNYLTVKLFHSPKDALPIFTTSILAPKAGSTVPITITIPNQHNPAEASYYLQLTMNSSSLLINGRNEDAYPNGQVFINGQPINADMAFRLSYDYNFYTLIYDLKHVMTNIWLIFPLLVVLWLPGWLLLEISGLHDRFNFVEQIPLSIGISLGLIPLIMLWTTMLSIKWTRNGVLIIAGFLVAVLLVRLFYKYVISRRAFNHGTKDNNEQQPSPHNDQKHRLAVSLALFVIFICSLAIRLIMVRDLATPAWVDSVHHALITRLILSHGSYSSSYLPYWDFNPTAYHPGFHSIAATFTWLSNLPLEQSLLILGQVLNALAVFSVYLFTKTLTQRSSAGLFAAIITGFLTPMPAYYTSWGRYTELTGLLILPAAFALIQLLMDEKTTKGKYWIIILGAITSAGLFMVHYRVLVFLACLILSYFVIYLLIIRSMPSGNTIWVLLSILITVAISSLLVLPWISQTIISIVFPIFQSAGTNTAPFFQDFSWAYLSAALGKQTLVIAGLGLIWGMIKQKRFTFLLLFWVLLLFLIANLNALQIPGGGLINNTSVEIMLFIPISILGGYFIDLIIIYWKDLIPKKLIIPFVGTIIIFIVLVAYTGAKQLVTIINPITILSRNADLPAIEWMDDNIPEKETIVINPFAWGYGLYAGSDGGYWISPLSGRVTLPPPVLYGLGGDIKWINEQSQKVIDLSSYPEALWEYLRANQLHYIYIGEKGGVLSPEKLSSSDHFIICYHKAGVWIFSIKP